MLDQHNQLLLANESLETGVVWIIHISRLDDGSRSGPGDILCLWEQILHELLLARQLNLNMALSKATSTTSSSVCLEAVDSIDGLIEVDKLNIAVKSLAGDSLHDDVNGLEVLFADDTGIATKESKNFRTVDRVWNLQIC